MNRGRLPALVGGGGSSVVGKRETRLYEPEERLHSFRRGVKTGAFCSASRNAPDGLESTLTHSIGLDVALGLPKR